MYTLRNILIAERGNMVGVRWMTARSASSPTEIPRVVSTPSAVSDVKGYVAELRKLATLQQASNAEKSKLLTEVADSIEKSQTTLGRALSRLHQSIPKPTNYETAEQKAIAAFTSVGITQEKAEEYAEVFVEAIKATQMSLKDLKVSVDHANGLDYQEMKDVLLDPANFTQEHDKERFLSTLRGMKKSAFRTSNFGAHQFETAISMYTKDAATLNTSVMKLTGRDLGNDANANKAIAREYIKKVNERADFLSRMYSLYNGAPQMGGLEAVMLGKDQALLQELFARNDFATKLAENGKNSGATKESILQYLKDTGITLPIPSLGIIGSYETDINLARNAQGQRADNSQRGETLYGRSNFLGIIDQMTSSEPISKAKVFADVVRFIVRPVEGGVSLDARARQIENSAIVTALTWKLVFDMEKGEPNNVWEKNLNTMVATFQKENALPKDFSAPGFIANMKSNVEYYNSIKQSGTGAAGKNKLILTQLRDTYVNQAAIMTASKLDQGSKFDGVSFGVALLVLPFVKFNTSTISVDRVAVNSATNDIAQVSAKVSPKENAKLESLGFSYEAKDGKHIYTPTEGSNYDLSRIILANLSLAAAAKLQITSDNKSLMSDFQLSFARSRTSGVDIREKGYDGIKLTKAKDVTNTVELKDMFTESDGGKSFTFNDKIGTATIDFSGVAGASYDSNTKKLSIPEGVKIVMKPEKDPATGILTKIVILPAKLSSQDVSANAEAGRESVLKNLAGSIYEMTRIRRVKVGDRPADSDDVIRTKEQFTKVVGLIADQRYKDAVVELLKMKKSVVVQNIIKALAGGNVVRPGQDIQAIQLNPERLAVILSYTYGAVNRTTTGVANKGAFDKARKGTHEAEKRFAPDRANDVNEAKFKDISSHTPTSLSEIYGKDQAISVSVFATPAGGKHRIDKLDGAITVSAEARGDLTDHQRDAVIKEHGKAIDAALARVNKILPEGNKMERTDYIDILKTGAVPSKFAGLKIEKEAKFFEARAMIQGNFCANKVEGMVLPTFSLTNEGGTYTREDKVVTPEFTDAAIFTGDRATVIGRTVGIGAMGSSAGGKSNNSRTDPDAPPMPPPTPAPNPPPGK